MEIGGVWGGERGVGRAWTKVKGLQLVPVSCSPVFPGLFEFCSRYTGASLQGATQLNNKVTIAQVLFPLSCGCLDSRPQPSP